MFRELFYLLFKNCIFYKLSFVSFISYWVGEGSRVCVLKKMKGCFFILFFVFSSNIKRMYKVFIKFIVLVRCIKNWWLGLVSDGIVFILEFICIFVYVNVCNMCLN